MKKIYLSVLFYFELYGFKGGIQFAYGLFKSGVEQIYTINTNHDKVNADLINSGFHFSLVSNSDQYELIKDSFACIKGCEFLAEEGEGRIRSGSEWLGVIFKEDVLAGWGWIKPGPLTYGSSRVSREDCVIHKCRTLRAFRRQRVYATLLVNVVKECQSRNIKSVFIGAKDFNTASLAAIEKVGFKFVERYDSGHFLLRFVSHLRGCGTRVISCD